MNHLNITQGEPDTDDDIHGKLAHLNAVSLDKLSLAKRYAYVTLLHPPNSDELGRFMTHGGALPPLPALTTRESSLAIEGLIEDGFLRKWQHGSSDCYELAGGYAFKKDLKNQLAERRRAGIRKKNETQKRRNRNKEAKEGIPFAYEDDGSFQEDSEVVELVRSQRGHLVSTRPGVWFNSIVPPPPGKESRHNVMHPQPNDSQGCVLRMLPSFNPGEDLSKLGAVLRFYLLIESDHYGRVSLDVDRLHRQLGPEITKRVSKSDIRCELQKMVTIGHLKDFKKSKGLFAYLRDSAQHMLRKKRYDRSIPMLFADKEYTYDSERYLAFFQSCKEHASTRERVHVGAFPENGKLKVVTEYVGGAATRFIKDYEETICSEPFCKWKPEQLIEIDPPNGFDHLSIGQRFYYAASTHQPAEWLEWLYREFQDDFDGVLGGSGGRDTHLILTHVLGMTPADFVRRAYLDIDRPPLVSEDIPTLVLTECDDSSALSWGDG